MKKLFIICLIFCQHYSQESVYRQFVAYLCTDSQVHVLYCAANCC